jgi:hypothetical protein
MSREVAPTTALLPCQDRARRKARTETRSCALPFLRRHLQMRQLYLHLYPHLYTGLVSCLPALQQRRLLERDYQEWHRGPVRRPGCCTKSVTSLSQRVSFSSSAEYLGARPLRYDERLGQYAFLSP